MSSHQVVVLLTVVAVTAGAARLFGVLARKLLQPAVVGEMTLGLVIGPTILGGSLLQASTRSSLSALADIGLAIFMFLIGLDTDHTAVREAGRLSWAVALGATIVPFGMGIAVASLLVARHAPAGATPFLLFMGLAMSITAFPVLARILDDFELSATPIGSVALSAAAICDVAAWTMLAALGAIARVAGTGNAWRTLLVPPFLVLMVLVVRPVLRRIIDRCGDRPGRCTEVLLVGLLLSAACTEAMGLHFIFGAFLFGLITPRGANGEVRRSVHAAVDPVCRSLLLPLYFVVAGLSAKLSGLGAAGLGYVALVIAAASVGKYGGTLIAARTQRVPYRQATVLATLMNTRGLTELVVLSVGLQAGLLDREVYTMMLVMALITTAAAGPLLRLLLGGPVSAAQQQMSLPGTVVAGTQP